MSVDDDAYDPDFLGRKSGSYVPAFFARDQEEAEEYCELLSDHDIPARCETDGDSLAEADADADEDAGTDTDAEQRAAGRRGMTHGVPVLVPETLLDEASEVIADREDFADFDEEEEDDEDDEDDYDLEELTEEDEHETLINDEDEDALFDQADDLEDIEEEEGEELF